MASVFEDQADGLRRLFVAEARRMIAVTTGQGESAAEIVAALAEVLTIEGRKVLVLDEFQAAGESHSVFGGEARYDLANVMLGSAELDTAVVKTRSNIDWLAGAARVRTPRPRMEARIGMINAFYRLAGSYDVVLVNACLDQVDARPGFVWACHDVVMLADGSASSATDVYAAIKLLHQADSRRFHLLYHHVEAERAATLFKGVAAVSRRHLHLMPEYLGVLPETLAAQATMLQGLVRALQAWPMPEQRAGNFPDLMRRLLRGADTRALQTLLK